MARPITIRNLNLVPDVKATPGIEVVPQPFWAQPKGLDYLNRKSRVSPDHAVEILNLYLDRGKLRSRKGTSRVGLAAADPVMAVVNFLTSSGIGFILRFTTTKLQLLSPDGAWEDVTGGTFTGSDQSFFTYTAFNDALVFSNGVDGLWEYAPLVGSLQQITEGPSAQHLTTFGGRILASVADGDAGRLQWSAKNNSRDWKATGPSDLAIGAGFEDLLSTPGGQVDSLMGVFPISDSVALMVRSGSVWTVQQTGDPDAPFRFERQFANLGSRSRHSIDSVPGGIVMFGTDDIYVLADNSINPIGQLIKDRLLSEAADIRLARGVYRPELKEYWLTMGGTDVVYRYSFLDKGWTKHRYGFDIRWFDSIIYHYEGVTWDDVVGSWDSQAEVWDNMLGEAVPEGFYFATTETEGNTTKEDGGEVEDDYLADGKTQQGIEIQTPVLMGSGALDKTEIIECQIEYEQGVATQTVLIEFSTDGGATWTQYSSKALTTTAASYQKLARAMKTIERSTMQFRLRSTTLGQLTLMGFYPFLVQGARINP